MSANEMPQQSRWAVMDGTLTEAQAAEQDAQITPATPTAQEAVAACKHLRTTHTCPGYDPLRPVVITCGDCGAVLSPDAHPPQPSETVAEAAQKVSDLWDNGCHDISWRGHFDGAMTNLKAALRALKGGEANG